MRLASPFGPRGEHIAIELPGGSALFTTRRGGSSAGPFASLNLAANTPDGVPSDDPAAVRRNRATLAGVVGMPWESFAFSRQVHGATIARAARGTPGQPAGEADGQVVTSPDVVAMVLVADCLPVALIGEAGVAMVHCGWRGLAAGIIQRAVAELATPTDRPPAAAIGPGIGACCYEVGEEVHAAFAADGPEVRDGRRLDLKAVARARLERAGVDEVHDVDLCTCCSAPELFYSHRRDRGLTGRQAGVAWRS